MIVAFLAIFIIVSQLLHSVAAHQKLGLVPYPFGATFLCYITHIVLLVTSIWYCGWVFGIMLFLCEFFSLVHSSIGWILTIPTLFFKDYKNVLKFVRFETSMLTPALIVSIVFCIVSFIVTPFSSLYHYMSINKGTLMVILSVALLCFFARAFVKRKIEKTDTTY